MRRGGAWATCVAVASAGNSPGMDETTSDPRVDTVTSVPLPTNVGDGADKVIAQQNQNPEVAAGGGEWPSPEAPPSGPAPGTAKDGAVIVDEHIGSGPDRRPESPAAEDEDGSFPPLREALDADVVAGGSQSVLDEDEEPGTQLKGATRLP